MSQTQIDSTISYELSHFFGELTVFAVIIAFVFNFRNVLFGKRAASNKTLKPSKMKLHCSEQVEAVGGGRICSHENDRQQKHPSTFKQDSVSCHALSHKIESMMQCASRRQAADALALYEDLKATNEKSAWQDALKFGKHRPVEVFNMLVQCAGRVRQPELVEIFLDEMTSAGIDRPLAFYESTMKMLASAKCYKTAMSVCDRLEADGLEPSPVTLSCLVSFAVELGDSDRAISFFNRLSACSTPSIRAYMTILRVYSRCQNWPKSLALLRDMQNRRAKIDCLVLNTVLSTGVAAGQLEAAKTLLEEFSHIGIADVISYNTLMKGLAQQKAGGRALSLLDQMCSAGLRPNAITFNTAIDAAVRSARLTDAWNMLARMVDAGVNPDKFTCTTLMKGLASGATSHQLSTILDLLRNVREECDAALSSSLFRSVIEAAAKVNDPDLTARAVAQMRDQQVMLPAQEYQRLLQVLMRDSNLKQGNVISHQPQYETMRSISAY